MIKLRHMDKSDKQFMIATIVAPIIVWWIYTGRNRYSAKGMK